MFIGKCLDFFSLLEASKNITTNLSRLRDAMCRGGTFRRTNKQLIRSIVVEDHSSRPREKLRQAFSASLEGQTAPSSRPFADGGFFVLADATDRPINPLLARDSCPAQELMRFFGKLTIVFRYILLLLLNCLFILFTLAEKSVPVILRLLKKSSQLIINEKNCHSLGNDQEIVYIHL